MALRDNNKLFNSIFFFGLCFSFLLSHPFPEHLNGKDSYVMASITNLIIESRKLLEPHLQVKW